MDSDALGKLLCRSSTPEARERSIAYLTEKLKQFLYPKERVLICFQNYSYGNISYLMEQAVIRCCAVPIPLTSDFRWINMLRLAFSEHVGCVIGPPLVLLGLSKVAKAMRTPLFIRNAVLAGYPCLDWMLTGIENGLDCKSWGCFSIGVDGMVCGFSCKEGKGIHLRDDVYGVDIVNDSGTSVPPGHMGYISVYEQDDPTSRCILQDRGVLNLKPCSCGQTSPKIVRFLPDGKIDSDLIELGQSLQRWSSILDCRLDKTAYGLEMEIIYFDGERLPKLPTAAKQILRPWNPEKDEPFWYFPLSPPPMAQLPDMASWNTSI